MLRPILVASLGFLVAALLSSCGVVVDAQPPAPAVINAAWLGCVKVGAFPPPSDASGPPGTGSIPAGFQPQAVVFCTQGDHTGRSGTVFVNLERTSTEVAPLLTYLARPSRRVAGGQAGPCQAMAWFPPWLFLVDRSGRWIAPEIPTDACGFALDLFEDGGPPYQNLPYRDRVVGRPS